MPKRVLLAEQSETARNVAESILRQNGYEVISVSSSEKALEVIEFTQPDLIVVGGNLITAGQKPLYERLQNESRTSHIPVMALAQANDPNPNLPDDSIIKCPFDPNEFLSKISARLSQPSQHKLQSDNPLGETALEENFLDEALGLDQIQVTDSEVMDKTTIMPSKKRTQEAEKMIGLDHGPTDEDVTSDTGRVESIMIDSDSTDIVQRRPAAKKAKPNATGKLDILSDQFGLSNPEQLALDDEDSAHDYNWFVNEMQQDKAASSAVKKSAEGESTGTPAHGRDPVHGREAASSGVDQFLDEFKKEIEKIESDTPDSVVIQESTDQPGASPRKLKWEEKLEDLTAEQVGVFTSQFTSELAEKIAEKIAAKIDAEKLLAMIKSEILTRVKNEA